MNKKDLEYLKLSPFKKFLLGFINFFKAIPLFFKNIGLKIWGGIKKLGLIIKDIFVTIGKTFIKGSWKTKVSYLIMGFGNLSRGQILRGLLFLLFQVVFIFYMITTGGYWLGKFDNLGDLGAVKGWDEIYDVPTIQYNDNSFKILLYGLLTIAFIVAFIVTWYFNIKQNKTIEEILATGKKLKSGKDDLRSLVDDQFHKTLLALPLLGILIFTVLPIIFMILVAFTNYDYEHDGLMRLFTWVGMDNFNQFLSWSNGTSNMQATFGELLTWTLIWAVFATFSNYFLGMLVAILINKKGIKLKKVWRGILVMTIAIPQFVSLLYVSKIFADNGLINGILLQLGIIDKAHIIHFWTDPTLARITVIIINIWIGIPYLMLISTGVLMNIPQDLYESSKIDGANTWQQYTKITLPYMLFVTGPYLLTQFIGNLNNFNVIYLLTGGGPTNEHLVGSGGSAGHTDLLITWLFKLTTGEFANYKIASVVGILIFVVVAVLSLIVYNVMPSTKNEEDFS